MLTGVVSPGSLSGAGTRHIPNQSDGKLAQAGKKGKPVFATAPYEPDERGVLRPILPERCGLGPAGERCSLYVDHDRPCKTGPRFPLAVVGCSVHREHRFTLYPPGHFRYGRRPVVPSSPSGPLLRESASGRPAWEASVFAGALDAARGCRWPADSPWDDVRRRRTQGRHLEFAARLVGVHPELAEGLGSGSRSGWTFLR